MILKRLVLEGFMRFREKQDISFPQKGLTLIIGDNGSGKSSILDAICFALYGKTIRADMNLLNPLSESASISIEFENNGRTYIVNKIITKDSIKGELFEDGEVRARDEEIQNYIKEILGLDLQSFVTSTIIQEGEMKVLVDSTPQSRLNLFMQMLNIKYKEYEEEVKKELEESTELLKRKERELEEIKKDLNINIDNMISNSKEQIKEYEMNVSKYNSILQKNKIESKKLENDIKSYIDTKIKADKITADIENMKKVIEEKKREINRLEDSKNEFEVLEKSYKELTEHIKLVSTLEQKRERYYRIQDTIELLKNAIKEKEDTMLQLTKDVAVVKDRISKFKIPFSEEKITKLRDEMIRLDKRRMDLEEQHYKLEAAINAANDKVKTLRQEYSNVKKKRSCTLCLQKLSDTTSMLKHITIEINAIENERKKKGKMLENILLQLRKTDTRFHYIESQISKVELMKDGNTILFEKTRLESLVERLNKIKKDLEEAKSKMQVYSKELVSLTFDEEKYRESKEKIDTMLRDKVIERFTTLSERMRSLQTLKTEVSKLEVQLATMNKRLEPLTNKINSLNYDAITRKLDEIKEESRNAERELNIYTERLAKEKETLNSYLNKRIDMKDKEKRKKSLENEVESIKSDIALLEELKNVFKNIGLETIERIIPAIEKVASTIVKQFSLKSIDLKLDKKTMKLNLLATTNTTKPATYLPVVEQIKISLALRMAISEIFRTKIEMLIIDEGEINYLDSESAKDVFSLLKNISEECNLILLSHLDLREGEHVLQVIKTDTNESMIRVNNAA